MSKNLRAMLSITLNDDETQIRAVGGHPDGNDKIHQVVAGWPGWSRQRRAVDGSLYVGPLSVVSALALSSTTLQLSWEARARERIGDLLSRFRQARDVLESGAHITLKSPPTPRRPHPFQRAGVGAMKLLDARCWLSDEMGLGKTAQALWLAHEMGFTRMLVCCPTSVKLTWKAEVQATLAWPCQVIDGTKRQRQRQFDELSALWLRQRRLVIVVGYDLLKHLEAPQIERLSRFVRDELWIGDEAHYLKSETSQRTRMILKHFCPPVGGARGRICMTGTPIRNTVDDVYSQVELVRPGTFHSMRWFQNRYTVQSQMKIPYTDRRGRPRTKIKMVTRRAKNQVELNTILSTLQVCRRKNDVADLPPKVFSYPVIELDAHTRRIYTAMRDYALLLLEEHGDDVPVLSPSCGTAVEAAARCEQIAQGCVGGVPEQLVSRLSKDLARGASKIRGKDGWLVFPGAAKIQLLLEKLEEIRIAGGRALVFSRFNAPLLWLAQEHQGVAVTGALSAEERHRIFNDFQEGRIQELYIQIKIAEGFTLHRAQDVLMLGREWAPAINAQAIDRCHRIGQQGTVNVQIPIVRGTIEERMHQALQTKELDAASVLCFRTIGDLKEALSVSD